MKLFLTAEAKHPDTLPRIEEYVGGFKGKKLGYIPTAYNGQFGWGSWKKSGSWEVIQTLGAKIEVIQLEEYTTDLVGRLKDQEILWVQGGFVGYLMYWIVFNKLDKTLREILEGKVYIGSSAGSMIMMPTLEAAEWFIGESEPGASYLPGLGFVDFDIYPHYEEHLLEEIKKHYKGRKMYLLKNGEAIIYENGKLELLGEERIVGSEV